MEGVTILDGITTLNPPFLRPRRHTDDRRYLPIRGVDYEKFLGEAISLYGLFFTPIFFVEAILLVPRSDGTVGSEYTG